MKGKCYRGRRLPCGRVDVTVNGRPLRHVVLHSPTGFEWGYGGSGPADLALSILADYFGENPSPEDLFWGRCRAQRYYQAFKWAFVARLNGREWVLRDEEIAAWLEGRAL